MAEVIDVQVRQQRGKRRMRRLRQQGSTPAVLYGHGKDVVPLAIPTEQIDAAIRHGARVVTLTGAVSEKAFIRELQWDPFAAHVLHVDFTRVYEHELVQVTVKLNLRGEAPGVREGGVIEQALHEATIKCEATSIPEMLDVNINELNLGESIPLSEVPLPPGAKLLDEPDQPVVTCVEPVVEAEEEEAAGEEAEPEVIGRKAEEEAEEGSGD